MGNKSSNEQFSAKKSETKHSKLLTPVSMARKAKEDKKERKEIEEYIVKSGLRRRIQILKCWILVFDTIGISVSISLNYVTTSFHKFYGEYLSYIECGYISLRTLTLSVLLCLGYLVYYVWVSAILTMSDGIDKLHRGCFYHIVWPWIYCVVMASVFIVFLAAYDSHSVKYGYQNELYNFFKKDKTERLGITIDMIQMKFKCCGVKDYRDWIITNSGQNFLLNFTKNSIIPKSCCMDIDDIGECNEERVRDVPGCNDELKYRMYFHLQYGVLLFLICSFIATIVSMFAVWRLKHLFYLVSKVVQKYHTFKTMNEGPSKDAAIIVPESPATLAQIASFFKRLYIKEKAVSAKNYISTKSSTVKHKIISSSLVVVPSNILNRFLGHESDPNFDSMVKKSGLKRRIRSKRIENLILAIVGLVSSTLLSVAVGQFRRRFLRAMVFIEFIHLSEGVFWLGVANCLGYLIFNLWMVYLVFKADMNNYRKANFYGFLWAWVYCVAVSIGYIVYLDRQAIVQIEAGFEKELYTAYKKNKYSDRVGIDTDELQMRFECCGVRDYRDWKIAEEGYNFHNINEAVQDTKIPKSCCKDIDGIGECKVERVKDTPGCNEVLRNKMWFHVRNGLLVLVSLLLLFNFLTICYFLRFWCLFPKMERLKQRYNHRLCDTPKTKESEEQIEQSNGGGIRGLWRDLKCIFCQGNVVTENNRSSDLDSECFREFGQYQNREPSSTLLSETTSDTNSTTCQLGSENRTDGSAKVRRKPDFPLDELNNDGESGNRSPDEKNAGNSSCGNNSPNRSLNNSRRYEFFRYRSCENWENDSRYFDDDRAVNLYYSRRNKSKNSSLMSGESKNNSEMDDSIIPSRNKLRRDCFFYGDSSASNISIRENKLIFKEALDKSPYQPSTRCRQYNCIAFDERNSRFNTSGNKMRNKSLNKSRNKSRKLYKLKNSSSMGGESKNISEIEDSVIPPRNKSRRDCFYGDSSASDISIRENELIFKEALDNSPYQPPTTRSRHNNCISFDVRNNRFTTSGNKMRNKSLNKSRNKSRKLSKSKISSSMGDESENNPEIDDSVIPSRNKLCRDCFFYEDSSASNISIRENELIFKKALDKLPYQPPTTRCRQCNCNAFDERNSRFTTSGNKTRNKSLNKSRNKSRKLNNSKKQKRIISRNKSQIKLLIRSFKSEYNYIVWKPKDRSGKRGVRRHSRQK